MTLILGEIGTGKTLLARSYLLSHKRTIILDPVAEHQGDRVAHSLDEFLEFFQDDTLPDRVCLVYRPVQDLDDYDEYLFDFLYDCRGWAIFIDEVDRFCNPHFIPKRFADLCNFRRHLEVDLILVARRAARISRELSALASRICVFRAHEPGDVDYIKKALGKAYADGCRNLPDHYWLEAMFPPNLKI